MFALVLDNKHVCEDTQGDNAGNGTHCDCELLHIAHIIEFFSDFCSGKIMGDFTSEIHDCMLLSKRYTNNMEYWEYKKQKVEIW